MSRSRSLSDRPSGWQRKPRHRARVLGKEKGQAALDQENAALAAEDKPTKPTRFETDKEKLRQIIRKTLNESFTVEDFARKLLQYGVTVKESRGRFSYLTPDRTKPITGRKLGDSFDKAAVLAALEQNALRSENTLTSNDGNPLDRTLSSNEGASDKFAPKQSVPQAPSIGRMVDREAKRAEGKGIGYDRWATMHNLKAWSKPSCTCRSMTFYPRISWVPPWMPPVQKHGKHAAAMTLLLPR